ncbi:MAG TPA: adenylate/guanylate cyclase domain-containing protein [Solirubrobacterales bacterium]|nr:adenylate/guanylate cyclase domain-containing protein [Solirubrobacterales bacterium]
MAGQVCGSCGTQNPEGARFCMSCGAPLATRCPSCGAESPPGAKFCVQCGTSLSASGAAPRGARPAAPPAQPSGAPGGQGRGLFGGQIPGGGAGWGPAGSLPEERRNATVLFADLSGYTAVAERLDPEAVKSFVDRALRRLGQEVVRYGGTVDKYIGDNVMAVFGAPVSHEDDPERAVRAGLAMQAAMDEINTDIEAATGVRFSLRVGINSGEVLAGQVGDGYTVIGDVVNVASRLQSAARPGSVTVGETTHRLTRGPIEYEELKPLSLKGKAEPVPAWEAVRLLVSGTAARGSRSAAPLIGREDESSLLLSLFDRVVREGRPHLVTVIGQAGVGKTRLLREFATRVAEREQMAAFRVGHCPAYGARLAYWALGEIIRGQFEIVDTDDSQLAWAKLLHGIEAVSTKLETDEPPERLAATIARPLGIEPPADLAIATGLHDAEDPQQMRDRLFSAVRSLVEAASKRWPVVIAIEDIHWADEGMLDLIDYMARWIRGPALIVCLARDELLERRPGWGGGRRNYTTIALEPLSQGETRELVTALLPGGNGSSANGHGDLIPQVAERSAGNPLFVEEMVNRIREEGSKDVQTLPESVHAVLAARLDSLSAPERRVLQHASVVGQTFWDGSLVGLEDEEGIDLSDALNELEEKDLVVSSPGSRLAGEHEYVFKHVLIRDVAYSTLPKVVRARRHAQVAAFIEERAAERSEGVVAMVADHYGRAAALGADADVGSAELQAINAKALGALESAGDAAASLYSNQEAIGHYETALSLGRELDSSGSDPSTRAGIAEKLGDVALRLGRVDQATEVWGECLDYHRRQEDLARVGDLHRKIGAGLWHKGDREGSIEHYQKGIDLLKDGPACLELVRLYEEAASLYMHTGDNMLAIYASEKALRLAERLGEAGAASRAHGIFGRVFGRIGDSERARQNLERSVELARDSDPGEAVRALLTLGYHLEVSEADYEGAGAAYREALELAEQTGDLPSKVELHAALAQLAAHGGNWEVVALEADASGSLAEREGLTGKMCFPYMMQGMLRWREGNFDEAAKGLRRAAELAEQVGRSEVAFQSLYWLAASLRQRGDHADADTELARALDLCERAGLVAQSIEAISARAVNLALAGRLDAAREAADEAERLADRLRYPVGKAASLEARGAVAADTATASVALTDAYAAWLELGRPLDAARCEYLRGRLLRESDPEEARRALEAAASAAEDYGVGHLASLARDLIPA